MSFCYSLTLTSLYDHTPLPACLSRVPGGVPRPDTWLDAVQGTTGETLACMTTSLSGLEHKVHIILNKVS